VRVLRREPLVAVLPAIHALAGYTTVPLADFGTNRSTNDGRAPRECAPLGRERACDAARRAMKGLRESPCRRARRFRLPGCVAARG
jgi:hypothetical protein